MSVNSTKTETDQHDNKKAPTLRPGSASGTRASRPPTAAATGPAVAGPAATGQQTPWQHQRDLPIAGTRPPRSATAADVVLAYLRLQAHELRTLEPAVRADEYDAVHQMRVATRRLRATLRS